MNIPSDFKKTFKLFFILISPVFLYVLLLFLSKFINFEPLILVLLFVRLMILRPYTNYFFWLYHVVPKDYLTATCFDISCPSDLAFLLGPLSFVILFLISWLAAKYKNQKLVYSLVLILFLTPFSIKSLYIIFISPKNKPNCIEWVENIPYLQNKSVGDVASVDFTDQIVSKAEASTLLKLFGMQAYSFIDVRKASATIYPYNEKTRANLCNLVSYKIVDRFYPYLEPESIIFKKKTGIE